MSRAIALSRGAFIEARDRQFDILRSAIVLASGAALILAGSPLPY
ncbi:MAG: hypothetical protein WA985_11200 [Erythrobacter sp.]